jgi:hypothetical protein
MFTVKFYQSFHRQVIEQADSVTILKDEESGTAEITLHRTIGIDVRRDIKDERDRKDSYEPPFFDKAIIENAAGKTTEIIVLRPIGTKQ